MDNLGIALLDTEKHFTLVSEKLDIGNVCVKSDKYRL